MSLISQSVDVTLQINDQKYQLAVQPWTSLVDTLREQLDLSGTKKGCDHGQCGACTILINGKRVLSCLILTVKANNADITTIEGVAINGQLHPLQTAFIEHDAFQCGYCTSGQICSAIGMLAEGKVNDRNEVKESMSGNLCRCGANINIIDAIMDIKNSYHNE